MGKVPAAKSIGLFSVEVLDFHSLQGLKLNIFSQLADKPFDLVIRQHQKEIYEQYAIKPWKNF